MHKLMQRRNIPYDISTFLFSFILQILPHTWRPKKVDKVFLCSSDLNVFELFPESTSTVTPQ
jgi:hypothetical protein